MRKSSGPRLGPEFFQDLRPLAASHYSCGSFTALHFKSLSLAHNIYLIRIDHKLQDSWVLG